MRESVRPKAGRAKRAQQGLKRYSELIVRAALREDIGAGDVTTKAIVPSTLTGEAVFLAKEDLTLAGLFIAENVFRVLDKNVSFKGFFKDGDIVKKGRRIAAVSGRLIAILAGERVALNFLQRLSGIATMTAGFVEKTKGTRVRVLDTRKTTPCMRMLERYAVKAGGGLNHRFGLFDRVLVKDNHIKAAGSVTEALKRVNRAYGEGVPIEVEVTNLKEVKEALSCGADIIMLDNMGVDAIKKALRIIDGSALTEASGGITLKNAGRVAKTGVDFISVGGLTHSARAVDISMEVVSLCREKKPRR